MFHRTQLKLNGAFVQNELKTTKTLNREIEKSQIKYLLKTLFFKG
jgi:hypothetical protein